MVSVEDFIDDLGLDSYKGSVYRWLLKVDASTASETAKESSVPYGKVYACLNELEAKGLITIFPSQPKMYKAIEPKLALTQHYEKKRQYAEDKIRQIQQLRSLSKIKNSGKGYDNELLVLSGRKKYMQMLENMVKSARKELLLIPGKMAKPPLPLRMANIHMLRNGVSMKIIIRKLMHKNKFFVKERMDLGAEARINTLKGMRLAVKDNKEVLLSIVEPGSMSRVSIYSSNKWFAESMAQMFEGLWKNGKKVRKI